MQMFKVAILDDYQNISQKFIDLKKLSGKYEIKVFSEPFKDENDAIEQLKDFEALLIMRERTKITSNLIKNLKKLKRGSKEFERTYQYEKSKLSIQRFKGLGEMNPEELWNTTLNPEKRNLLQVQYSKNIKKDQEIIHTLMGNDVALRKDFIVSNAINVSNLDI